MEIAHVGVVAGEQDADVGGEAGQDQRACAEVLEQGVERGGEEAAVLGLEDEVVIRLVGREQFRDPPAARRRLAAVGDELLKVGLPAAEVVVDVEGGNAGGAAAIFQSLDVFGGGEGVG